MRIHFADVTTRSIPVTTPRSSVDRYNSLLTKCFFFFVPRKRKVGMITLRVPILTRRIFTLIWKRDERVAQKHVLGIVFIACVISKIRAAVVLNRIFQANVTILQCTM